MNTSHGPLAILARHWQRDPDEVRLDRAFARIADSELRIGNRVRLLRDARENYPAWLDAINAAAVSPR